MNPKQQLSDIHSITNHQSILPQDLQSYKSLYDPRTEQLALSQGFALQYKVSRLYGWGWDAGNQVHISTLDGRQLVFNRRWNDKIRMIWKRDGMVGKECWWNLIGKWVNPEKNAKSCDLVHHKYILSARDLISGTAKMVRQRASN